MITYQLFQIDAWGNKEEGYTYNDSFLLYKFKSRAKDVKRLFRKILKKNGIIFNVSTVINQDDGVFELCERKTDRPLFVLKVVG